MSPRFLNWRDYRTPYPHNIIIDPHSYCNARCRICPYPKIKGDLPMGFMDDELFKRIIDEFAELKASHDIRGHVIFCNMGEPFVDPDIFWKIDYVLSKGLKLPIQTNAALLTPEKIDRLVKREIDEPIHVSVHGISQEVYEEVMGLPYDKVMRNLAYLLDNYDRDKVRIRSFAHKWPAGEGKKVKKFWRQYGYNVRIRIPNNRSGLLNHILPSRFIYPGAQLRGCKKGLPLRDMVITFDGKAILCCEDMGRRVVLGDLNKHTLLEVWNGKKAHAIMDHLYGGGWGGEDDFICRKCEFGLSTQLKRLCKNIHNQVSVVLNSR